MTSVQWLKLDKTNLSEIPKEMGNLLKLEHLSLTKNNLEKLHGELTELNCLRTLNLRYNKVKSSGIPAELFQLEELSTLDLSHNNLKEVPEGLERAKALLVLNLSYNQYVLLETIQLSNLYVHFQHRYDSQHSVREFNRSVVFGFEQQQFGDASSTDEEIS